jgi:hypothetical protein
MKFAGNSGIIFCMAILLLVLIALPQAANSQGRNQEVTIIAPYQPTISDAYKMTLMPTVKDTVVETPPMVYNINSTPIYSSYGIESLSPVFVEINPEETYRRSYLRAGFGNYMTPYAELFTNSLQSDKFALGFHARHLSSTGNIEDYATSAYSQNEASFYGKRYLKDKVLSAKLKYDRDVVHYYGFEPENYAGLDLSDDDLKQRFSLVGANIGLESNYKRGKKMHYAGLLDFYYLDDLYETNEMMVALDLNLNSKSEYFAFVEKQELGVDLAVDYYNNQDSILSQGTTIARLKPYINLDFGYLNFFIGVEGAMASDSSSDFYVYPDVKASYKVIPDYLRFYVSVTGGLQRNAYREITAVNPWVNSIFPLGNTNTKYNIKGGLTGTISQVLDYNFSVSYSDIENMLFFENDFSSPFNPETPINLGNKFTGVYDNVKLTAVNLELAYQQTERLRVMLTADYRHFEMTTQDKPWQTPAFIAKVSAKYLVVPKLSATADLFYNSSIYAQAYENNLPVIKKRDGFVDINLGAEYSFTDRISVFAQLNNVASVRYYRWYNYPSQRINVMGGLSFSF